ncbi:MAG TPA: S8 family peptidase [Terriglobia bacterium]|nr:S8 family peptidase [Terriglobia bacterium]
MPKGRDAPSMKNFVISIPVRKEMAAQAESGKPSPIPLIISVAEPESQLDLGLRPVKEKVKEFLRGKTDRIIESDYYIFASLLPKDIEALATTDWVHQIWKDETCYSQLLFSTETVKAAAAWRTFAAQGKGVTWAVMDTGIDSTHPHFKHFSNVDLNLSKNFSLSNTIEDLNGHGTHVAGIIAGASQPKPDHAPYRAATFVEDQDEPQVADLPACPSGVAPMAKLVNLKVLNDDGTGPASAAILGLEYLRKVNQANVIPQIDGVNMSLGYPYDPEIYGCGHSPLCEEVNRAAKSGLVVVISCGNCGYGNVTLNTGQRVPTGVDLSITDPANAACAIAVGSVHKSAPHFYGVSYFSSKGPTSDGRIKPDLVAPGEKVISCSIHLDKGYEYEEGSGTSVAAPHVSGAAAAFLSAHSEFKGSPWEIKNIFLKSAVDLGRDRDFQGAGLLNLLQALMSV